MNYIGDISVSAGDYIELYKNRRFYIRSLMGWIRYPVGTKAEVIHSTGTGRLTRLCIQFNDGNIAYGCDMDGIVIASAYEPGEEPSDTKVWAERKRKANT